MLIVCPSCASEYTLDPDRIGPAGRTVRCAACREPWFVPPPEAASAILSPPGEAVNTAGAAPAARRPGRGRGRAEGARHRGRGALAALLVLAAAGAAVLGREPVVRALPQTARLYAAAGLPVNLRGLALRDVAAHQVPAGPGGAGRLVVEGDVVGVATGPRPVPPIAVEIRDEADRILYRWTAEPPRAVLEPQERARFRAELSAPPARGQRVVIRFAAVDTGETPVSLASASPAHEEVR